MHAGNQAYLQQHAPGVKAPPVHVNGLRDKPLHAQLHAPLLLPLTAFPPPLLQKATHLVS